MESFFWRPFWSSGGCCSVLDEDLSFAGQFHGMGFSLEQRCLGFEAGVLEVCEHGDVASADLLFGWRTVPVFVRKKPWIDDVGGGG